VYLRSLNFRNGEKQFPTVPVTKSSGPIVFDARGPKALAVPRSSSGATVARSLAAPGRLEAVGWRDLRTTRNMFSRFPDQR
jgi:hypothetical protein